MKGFITLAVGKEKYYKLALNLLKSYRANCSNQFPFVVVCDRKKLFNEKFTVKV